MIPAYATTEYLGSDQWEVEVTGHFPPFDEHRRVYTIHAEHGKEHLAAQEALAMFGEEMEALGIGGKPNGVAHF